MTKNDILTLAQRLREYNHNPHHINPASDAFHGLITDSADALAQLAAIQGGMGDEPLVVATAILGGLFHGGSGPELGDIDVEVCTPHLEKIQCETVDSSDDVFMPLMTVAQHQRITAAMAAELADAKSARDAYGQNAIDLQKQRDALRAENEALVRDLRGKHSLVGATYEHLIRQRDEALAKLAELAAIEGQEPVLWFRSLIGAQCKPDGRCYDVVFSPCEGFIPLYALPPGTQQDQPK